MEHIHVDNDIFLHDEAPKGNPLVEGDQSAELKHKLEH